jgi:endonuclease/exonuclease/phosphatase family metal-dependent hydrolase
MKVLSCNVRADNPGHDKDNQWKLRKGACCAFIADVGADVICTQELRYMQFVDLAAALPDYDSFGIADEALNRDPMNTIFWRRDRFERASASGYWLSKTPHVPGSKSWASSCIRVANWVRLIDRASGSEFRVVNTHLDHISQTAREGQAHVILQDAAGFPEDYPQIFTGDLNADRANAAIEAVKSAGWQDAYEAVHGPGEAGCTIHQFLGPESPSQTAEDGHGRIDWIFMRGPIRATGADILKDARDGRFPSDHYFVTADLELTG